MPCINDDKAMLDALDQIWTNASKELGRITVYRVHVTLVELTYASAR